MDSRILALVNAAARWINELAARPRRAAFSLSLLALLLRIPTLASRPVWYDEAFSVLFSSKGFSAMLEGTINSDVHPLLYYSLLSSWMRVVGQSAVAVRGLSVILGVGMVVLGYGIGLRVLSKTQALAGGALIACLPFQVHYAQEARMYSLLGLLLLGATLSFIVGLQTERVVPWFAFSLLGAAALYTHNLAALYLAPLATTSLFLRDRRTILFTLGASLLAVLIFLPWLTLLPGQLRTIAEGYWIGVPGLEAAVRTALVFVGGLPVPEPSLPVLLFLVVLVLTFAGLETLRSMRARSPDWKRGGWLLYMSVAPPLLMFLISQRFPVYLDRAMLPSGAMMALWLAWSFGQPGGSQLLRRTAAVCLLGAIGLGLWGFYTYRGFPYAPFAAINRAIRGAREPGEVVLHSNKLTALPAAYEDPDLGARYLMDPPGSGSATLATATQQVLGLMADSSVSQAIGDAPGVWLILFRQEVDEYGAQGELVHPAVAELEASFSLEGESTFGDVVVMHFVQGVR